MLRPCCVERLVRVCNPLFSLQSDRNALQHKNGRQNEAETSDLRYADKYIRKRVFFVRRDGVPPQRFGIASASVAKAGHPSCLVQSSAAYSKRIPGCPSRRRRIGRSTSELRGRGESTSLHALLFDGTSARASRKDGLSAAFGSYHFSGSTIAGRPGLCSSWRWAVLS